MNLASLNLPNSIEMEKSLLSALMLKDGQVVPKVAAILEPDDFYRPEHQIIFRVINRVYFSGTPLDILSVEDELRKTGELERVNRRYLFSLLDLAFSTAHAESHAKTIKQKADLRNLINTAQVLADFFAKHFNPEIANMKAYADRRSGFFNRDQQQFFNPGLYVIGATPAAGKTTFCWQLHETVDDLLALLRPFCSDKAKAPVVCLDYLQIVPTSRESAKLGIDDAVRKLKKFQRDTNTTFIVISSFNRTNYA